MSDKLALPVSFVSHAHLLGMCDTVCKGIHVANQ